MPENKHYEKWIIQAPVGILICGAAIMFIFYTFSEKHLNEENWMMYGLATATVFMAGVGLLSNAIIHKIKSDLSRKHRHRKESNDLGESSH